MGGLTRALVTSVFFLAALATQARATSSNYFVDSTQAVADRPSDVVYEDGDFTLEIHRHFEGALEQRLLHLAEAVYPTRDVLIDRAISRGTEIGSDSTRTSLWWCDGLGVSRVPFAITYGAVEFYRKLTLQFRSHNYWGAWDHNLFWTGFAYRATIQHRDEYYFEGQTVSDVYVAEMNLSWSFDDGTFVPVSVAHRTVVLTPEGRVVAIEGDGGTVEDVFLSSHRGIGRVDRVMR